MENGPKLVEVLLRYICSSHWGELTSLRLDKYAVHLEEHVLVFEGSTVLLGPICSAGQLPDQPTTNMNKSGYGYNNCLGTQMRGLTFPLTPIDPFFSAPTRCFRLFNKLDIAQCDLGASQRVPLYRH